MFIAAIIATLTAGDIIAIITAIGAAVSSIIVAWHTGRKVDNVGTQVSDVQTSITKNGVPPV